MKYTAVFLLLLTLFSCKKKYQEDYIGPQGKEEVVFNLVDTLSANKTVVDFSATPVLPFFFRASFDKKITWKLTIEGDISGATKTFIGTSKIVDSLLTTWKGEQDSLYYFINETCKVTLSDYYPVDNNYVYNSLEQNNTVIAPKIKLTTSTKIAILKPKPLKDNEFALFNIKRTTGTNGVYTVAYDTESNLPICSSVQNAEADPSVLVNNRPRVLTNNFLPLSKNGGPINRTALKNVGDSSYNSSFYFQLKGSDLFNKDYYIGRVERTFADDDSLRIFINKFPNISPKDVWFNVFVYGFGDGAKMNYTIKEDDDGINGFNTTGFKSCYPTPEELEALKYTGKNDDAFEKSIVLDFYGWKLISVPYSDFTAVKDGINGDGKGEYNPNKILSVQFSLVASKQGGSGHVAFDYPVLTIGGPLKY